MRHHRWERSIRKDESTWLALLGIAGVSAAAFGLLTHAVAERKTSYVDGRARRHFPKRRRRTTKRAATVIGPLGKEYVHAPIAVAIGAYAWQRGSVAAALAPPLASGVGTTMSKLFERHIRPRTPPPGRHSPTEPSYPSGHSLETMAVSATSAYVLAREGLLRPEIAAPAALVIPVASGIGRLYLDRHWSSDVVAGWLAGLSVAAACASVYELLSE